MMDEAPHLPTGRRREKKGAEALPASKNEVVASSARQEMNIPVEQGRSSGSLVRKFQAGAAEVKIIQTSQVEAERVVPIANCKRIGLI